MSRADLVREGADEVSETRYPDVLDFGGVTLKLRYRFDPGHPLDGVTAIVPLHLINRLRPQPFEWLVPGMLRDKVNALVRALPKALRRACVPLPQTVTACLERIETDSRDASLCDVLTRVLRELCGIEVPRDTWEGVDLPSHLTMNYAVIDERAEEVATSRDLARLQSDHGEAAQDEFAPQSQWERSGIRAWGELTLPERVEFFRGRERLEGYPALVDEQDSVRLTLLDTADKASAQTRRGIARLVRLSLKEQVRALERSFTPTKALVLSYLPYGSGEDLRESLVQASIERAVWADDGPVRDAQAFAARLQQVRARLQVVGQEYLRLAHEILAAAHALRAELEGPKGRAFKNAAADMTRQLRALVFPGFIARVPYRHLQHYPRYLAAIRRRLEKAPLAPERDEHHTRELAGWRQRMEQRAERNRKAAIVEPALEEFAWMLEEQRVSLFAQELKTPYPVSYKRLEKAWSALG